MMSRFQNLQQMWGKSSDSKDGGEPGIVYMNDNKGNFSMYTRAIFVSFYPHIRAMRGWHSHFVDEGLRGN